MHAFNPILSFYICLFYHISYSDIWYLCFVQTELYIDDWIGLRALDEVGKVKFVNVSGDHLDISHSDMKTHIVSILNWWNMNCSNAKNITFFWLDFFHLGLSIGNVWTRWRFESSFKWYLDWKKGVKAMIFFLCVCGHETVGLLWDWMRNQEVKFDDEEW